MDNSGNVFESTQHTFIWAMTLANSEEKGERKCWKTSIFPEQQDLQEKGCKPLSPKHFWSSIGGLLYHKNKRICWIKGSDKKKILYGKKENWWKYQVGIERILKNTLSISKINCCVSDHLSLLKLHWFYVSFSMLARLYK